MPTTPHRALRRGRAVVGIAAVAAAVVLLASACQVPASASQAWTAWKAGKPADAKGMKPSARTALFSKTYHATDEWVFVGCVGASDPTCTWVDRAESSLRMSVLDYKNWVEAVGRDTVDSAVAGRMFHEWRTTDKPGAAPYGTTTAVNALFGHTYSAGAGWLPPSECDGVAGGTYCTWTSTDGHTLSLKTSSASGTVVEVLYDA